MTLRSPAAPRLLAMGLAATLVLMLLPVVASAQATTGAPVVISQVYGGGGNSGAPLANDFVELHNRSDAPVDLVGRSVQYAAATGTAHFGANTGMRVDLSGTIEPGGYHLVQLGGGSNGEPLPAPDDTGTITMAAGSGKVALVEGTDSLGCNGGSTPCDDDQLARIIDLVGYGSANFFEGSGTAPTLNNSTAAHRKDDGAEDTDDNAADFTAGAPNPRNSGTDTDDPDPVEICEVDDDGLTRIHEIQGAGGATPIAGQDVVTRGVVTADFTSGGESGLPSNQGLRGFHIEAIEGDRDDDPATSEGLFVFDGGGTFDGALGDLITVAGSAGEAFGVTQVSMADWDVCDAAGIDATLPAPAALPLPTHPDDRAGAFEPLESMRVTHDELTIVEFFQLERFGEVRLSASGVLANPTNAVDPHDDEAYEELLRHNAASNIVLDDGRTGQNLDPLPYVVPGDTLRIGDQLRDRTAILHFGFRQWRLQPVDVGAITEELRTNRTRPRPVEAPDVGGTLTVASFNVLNYFNGDGFFVGDDPATAAGFPTARGAKTPSELARQTEKIVDAITRFDADVVGLIEIENDDGERQAAAALVDAINTALGEDVYDFIDTGRIGTDAIKQAFIYKPAAVEPKGDHAILDSSVDPRFEDQRSRPVLAQTFKDLGSGSAVTVAVNHLKSKGSRCDADDNDPRQGNCNGVRDRAAAAMVDWLLEGPTKHPSVGTLIIGDLNAYAMEDPIATITDGGYTDLMAKFSGGAMPYTYTFDATQGYLDHALADGDLLPFVTGTSAWNINADEVPAIDYQESVGRFRTADVAERFYDPSAFRSSDHDPVLVGLEIPGCPRGSETRDSWIGRQPCPGNRGD